MNKLLLNRVIPSIAFKSSANMMPMKQQFARNYFRDPFTEIIKDFERTSRQMDRLMNQVASNFDPLLPVSRYPRYLQSPGSLAPMSKTIAVEKDAKNGSRLCRVQLGLQDFKPEDINVSVKDRLVTVKARREEISSDDSKSVREFTYEYTLPTNAESDKVRSLLETDGTLIIEAPLPEEKPKEIPVSQEN